jgi:general secretion pathway protein F
MPVFQYTAINPTGKAIKGTVDADSIRAARQKLRTQNIFPTQIVEAREASKAKSKDVKNIFSLDRVSTKKLAVATRLLATLSGAGLPLVAALQALSEQVDSPELRRIVLDIRERVEQGSSMAKALAAYPKVFPRLYTNMVASGEASGTLDGVLFNLAEYYEAQIELKRKVTSALFYPVLMLGFCVLVVIGLVTFVVPSIVEIFIKQKITLPLPTQIVIAFSNFLIGYWWLLIAIGTGAVVGSIRYYKTPKGRLKFDEWLLRLPLVGNIYKKVTTARVAITLGTLLGNGVELLSAIDIVKNIVGNVHMAKALEEARDGVREGRSLAKELSRSGYFPNLLCQMIAIGERSGKLEEMLQKAGDAFSKEADATITGLTTLIEPLMIMMLGVIVFAIVISVLLPMTELMKVVQPGAR